MSTKQSPPPLILLGGDANALSVARSLSRDGVPVYGIGPADSPVRWSRACRWIAVDPKGDVQSAWAKWLLGPDSDSFRGAVVLSCCDDGIELIARHRAALEEKFLLDDSNINAQLRMLDKLATYQAAVAAGVPTPRFWIADSIEHLHLVRHELRYPLLVKPLHSHAFASRIGKGKFVRAASFDEAVAGFRSLHEVAGLQVMLVEAIPGPDDRLCSYYTYLDDQLRPQFDFTKRIIRRSPANRGPACYHATDRNPEVKELALRLFQHVGLRGLANAEFKRDERDGQLKLIECNARFTAANCLVAASGIDLGRFVYNRLTGRPLPSTGHYKTDLYLWDPVLDCRAFFELRRARQLTWRGWRRSLRQQKILPYFRWSDPLPSLMCAAQRAGHVARQALSQLGQVARQGLELENGLRRAAGSALSPATDDAFKSP